MPELPQTEASISSPDSPKPVTEQEDTDLLSGNETPTASPNAMEPDSENKDSEKAYDDDGSSNQLDEAMEVEFQTISQEWETYSGFILRGTYSISPWIRKSDEKTLQATWAKVSPNKFPDVEKLKLAHTYRTVIEEWMDTGGVSEVVYAVGCFEVENLSEGFDITPNGPVTVPIAIHLRLADAEKMAGGILVLAWGNGARTFLQYDYNLGFGPSPYNPELSMDQNRTRLPFMLVCRIPPATPNNPTPLEDFEDRKFVVFDQEIIIPRTWGNSE